VTSTFPDHATMEPNMTAELSIRTRAADLERLRTETFDVVVIGAGISGAATARHAASRGLKVALVEQGDIAAGASSSSSKLVHGGLRYLPKLELGLVFESLRERAHWLSAAPHLVRPMPFFVPVRDGDAHSELQLSAGLLAYDLLSLGRTPHLHRHLDRDALLTSIPQLGTEGLRGGFQYWDAAMWDDALCVETVRAARTLGAAVVTRLRVESMQDVGGLKHVRATDLPNDATITLRTARVVVCTGAWTDVACARLMPGWTRWLRASVGVHLVIPFDRLPLPGAVVLQGQGDGRMSLAIPRPELGTGVVIVGTTDAPVESPDQPIATGDHVKYLLDLLARTFPHATIDENDVIATYAGVRPLLLDDAGSLQAASREHRIEEVRPGVVVVAGGKYTTHRSMAEEAVKRLVSGWKRDAREGTVRPVPKLRRAMMNAPVNPAASLERLTQAREEARLTKLDVPEALWSRYAADALAVRRDDRPGDLEFPGFPCFSAQLRHLARHEGVLQLDDVWFRRLPLALSRADHALPFAAHAARILASELGHDERWAREQVERLRRELARRDGWRHDTTRRAA